MWFLTVECVLFIQNVFSYRCFSSWGLGREALLNKRRKRLERFVQREFCPKRVLSKESFVQREFCPKRVLSKESFVQM